MFFRLILIAFIIFLLIDILWLGIIAKNLYKNEIGHIMKEKPNWLAAIIFYILFIVGLVYFVIEPAVDKDSFIKALLPGLLFGLITYATYDLTNLATIKNWPLKITFIDLIWGSFLSGATASLSFLLNRLWV